MSRKGEPREPVWSPREVVRLRSYAARGLSTREAAVLIGRSWPAVMRMASRLGVHFHGPMGAPKMNRNRSKGEWRKELQRLAAE
jgi:hypothetical protein